MKAIFFAAALVLAGHAVAQTAAVMTVGGSQNNQSLRAGTPVLLKMTQELTTKGKHLKVGDRFTLEVAEPVAVNGMVVIPVGAPAVGEVTSIRNKGMWGKSGNIETRLLYVSANDRRLRITGSVGDKGVKAGGGAIAASAIVFLPAGFFMTGTSAVIPIGSSVHGILDEDVAVAFAPSSTAPMVVSTPAPASASVTTVASPARPAATAQPAVLVKQ